MKTILRIESVHDGNGMFNSIDYNRKALEELYVRHNKFASPCEDSKLKALTIMNFARSNPFTSFIDG